MFSTSLTSRTSPSSTRPDVAPMVALLVVAILFLGFKPASAQTYQTWRSEATSGSWQGSTNWWKGSAGPIEFGQQEWNNNDYTSQTNDNGGSTFNTWRFLFQSGASSAHTFTGDAVRFNDYGGNDPSIINQSSATHSINLNIQGDGDAGDPLKIQIDNNGGGGLTFGGTVNNQGSDIHVIGTASSAATVRFNGVISGSAGFYKENSNITLLFDAANTYTGQLTIQAGTVRLNDTGDTFGASTQDIRLHSTGVLDLNGVSTTVGSVAEYGSVNSGNITLGAGTLTIAGADKGTFYQSSISGTGGLTMAGSGNTIMSLFGTQSYTGTTTVSSGSLTTASAMSSAAHVISGGNFSTQATNQIADAATLTVNSGTFTLGGADTMGAISGSGGTININGSYALTTSSSSSTTYSGVIAGTGGQLVKAGSGTLTLSGANTYTGTTTLSAGTLAINNNTAIGTGTLTITGGVLNNTSGSDITLTNNNAQNWNGNFTYAGTGNLNMGTGAVTMNAARTVTVSANTLTVGGAISGAFALTKTGTGTLTLSGNNTFSGGVSMPNANNGKIIAAHNNALGSGTFTFAGSSIVFELADGITIANAMTVSDSGNTKTIQLASGATSATYSGAIAINESSAADHFRLNVGSGGTLTFSGNLSGNRIYKLGDGTVVLSGNNTYTGLTTVSAGVLNIRHANALGTTAAGTTVTSGAALELQGGITIGAEALSLSGTGISTGGALRNISGDNSYAGAVTLAAATRINSDAGLLTLSGAIGGAGQNLSVGGAGNTTISNAIGTTTGTLTKDGAGTLNLSGANTYTGTTTINAGTLTLSSGSAIADTGAVVMANATSTVLNVNASETIGNLSGGGTLGGNIAIAASQTLTVNQTTGQTYAGAISGAGGLTQNGSSTLTLSGANSYTGATTINAGTLTLGAANVIGDSSIVTMTGGGFNLGANAETLHSLNMSGGTLSRGGATLTLNNASSITGGTVILSSQADSRINTTGLLTLGTASMNYTASSPSSTTNALVLGGDIAVNASTTFDFIDSGGNTGNPRINLNNANRVFDVASSANLNVGWDIWSTTAASGLLTKNGTGTLTLNGTGTYAGATTINAGTLVLNGSNTASAITINSGATLAGTGSAGGTTVNSGGLISPGGSSIGTLATTTLTLNGDGGYTFTINNVTGSAGTNWDLLNVGSGTGLVTINSSSGTPFTISLNGSPTGWSDAGTYAWDIISSNNLSGFAADKFDFNLTGFNGGVAPTGTFFMSNSGTALVLNYSILSDSIWSGGTANWNAGFSPAIATGGNAFFTGAGSGTATNNIASATLDTLQSITFNSTAGAYTLAANAGSAGDSATPLILTVAIVNNSTADQTLNLAMTFNSDRVVDTASGNISIGGVINGAGGLTKNGSSTLTLTADNTLTGPIQINDGTLATTGSGGFANTANLTVASGATYNVGVSDQINSLTSPGSLVLGAGTLTICGTASSSISGAISGSGSLTKGGSGTLTLSNNNSGYSGETRLEGGVLEIGNNGALGTGTLTFRDAGTIRSTDATDRTLSLAIGTFAGANNTVYTFGSVGTGNLTFSGTDSTSLGTVTRNLSILNGTTTFGQSFTNTGAITKSGSGTLVLSGNNTYTGATTINAGTLQISSTGLLGGGNYSGAISNSGTFLFESNSNQTIAGIISGAGAITKNGTSTLTLSATNTYTGGTTINGGTLAFTDGTTSAIGNGTITINNGSTLSLTKSRFENQSIIFGSSGGGSFSTLTNNIRFTGSTITTTGGATNFISGSLWDIAGPTFNVAEGTDDVDLQVSNILNRQGITKSGDGKLLLTANNNLVTGGVPHPISINAGALEIGASGRLVSGSYAGNMTNNGIFIYSGTNAQTLSGIISGSGALTQNAASTLTLSGNNTYSGTTTISDGTIEIGAAGRLGAGSYAGNISNDGTLIYSGTNAQTLSGIISGTGALTKNAASTLTLSGDNTYSGATTINAGTLVIGNGLTAGSLNAASAITVNGTLAFNRSDDITQGTHFATAAIGGTGSIVQNGAGTLTLNAANTYSGGTTLNTGTLVIGNAAAAGTGTITQAGSTSLLKIDTTGTISNDMSVYNVLASQSATLSGAITVNNATFDVETGDTLTLSGGVGGSGGVTKNGTGTLVLSGSNTYSGATTVNAGTLEAANANALGDNTTVQINGGSLLVTADDAINGKNITLESSATGSASAAGLAFSGTYNGTAGSLTLNADSIIDLGTGSVALHFSNMAMGIYNLAIYNWSGTTLWGGGSGNNTDQFYVDRTVSDNELNRISFYSGFSSSSFVGTGFQLSGGLFNQQIIPVPEPETWATGILLVLSSGIWLWRKRTQAA